MSQILDADPPRRLGSLDAYRGLVMLMLASHGLGLDSIPAPKIESGILPDWGEILRQLEHAPWRGCTVWDMIQPSFMFIAGASMPLADAAREARGESWRRRLIHVVWRSFLLIALGIFLRSGSDKLTNFTFEDVVTQIGLGYTFVFLLLRTSPRVQFAAALAILAADWALFAAYPAANQGFLSHWDKNTNVATAFDRWFLNLFPRAGGKPYTVNGGGYVTLSFIPSMATMIFGALSAQWLRSRYAGRSKVVGLVLAGAVCLGLSMTLDQRICPIVKRIWTPSWVFYSTAWTLWVLAVLFAIIDVIGLRRWAFPLIVVGMNSIAMYVMIGLTRPWIIQNLERHERTLSGAVQRRLGFSPHPGSLSGAYLPVTEAVAAMIVLWLICLWMYRRKIFLRI